MNKKLKTNLIVGAFGLLIVDRFCLVTLNKKLEEDKRDLIRANQYIFNVSRSLISKIRPEEIPNALTDLEFYYMTLDK